MSLCGRKALTLLSSVFAVCGLGLLGVAVSTDYWLYLEEGVVLPLNQSTETRMALHSGLWRVCFTAARLVAFHHLLHGHTDMRLRCHRPAPLTSGLFGGRQPAVGVHLAVSLRNMFPLLSRANN